MALPRYAYRDPYTLEELRREYQGSDWRGRIRLLRRLTRDVGVPSEITDLAIADQHVQVRQWIARFGVLFREHLDRLKQDPDEFVRARRWENPSSTDFWMSRRWQESFGVSSPLERLAMVRNPSVDDELIEKVFDPENQEFGLDTDARRYLVSAFLSNERALNRGQISYSDWCTRVAPDDACGFIDCQQSDRKHFDKLWELASKWPAADIELGVRYWVYRYVGADDKTKAETYRACKEPALRRAILRNTRPPVDPYGSSMPESPSTSEITKLALQDDDPECRRLALERAGQPCKNRRHKLSSYGWPILWSTVRHVITIALAFMICSSAATTFERAVSAVLVLIYGSVTWMSTSRGVWAFGRAVVGSRRYCRIIGLLDRASQPRDLQETLTGSLEEQEDALDRDRNLLIPESIWTAILMSVAIYYLVRALL